MVILTYLADDAPILQKNNFSLKIGLSLFNYSCETLSQISEKNNLINASEKRLSEMARQRTDEWTNRHDSIGCSTKVGSNANFKFQT